MDIIYLAWDQPGRFRGLVETRCRASPCTIPGRDRVIGLPGIVPLDQGIGTGRAGAGRPGRTAPNPEKWAVTPVHPGEGMVKNDLRGRDFQEKWSNAPLLSGEVGATVSHTFSSNR